MRKKPSAAQEIPEHELWLHEPKAKADLEDDVEELTSALNTHRFLTCVGIIVIFDAVVFQAIDNWMAPLCLTVIELIGIFVLARHYEIPEAIKLTFFIMKMVGKREKDPGMNEADSG